MYYHMPRVQTFHPLKILQNYSHTHSHRKKELHNLEWRMREPHKVQPKPIS